MLVPLISETTSGVLAVGAEPPPPGGREDISLEDVARDEREYVRERLRQELNREPTGEEVDEWVREHTEGY